MMKSFADLSRLKAELAQREQQAREQARAERLLRSRRDTEQRLFREAVGDATPLRADGRVSHGRVPPSAEPLQRQRDEQAALAASLSDDIDIEQLLETDETLSFRRKGIGADIPRRLRRGEWVVQAQLDLHGLRVEEARETTIGFLAAVLRRELRCVRIIHGKGLGSANKEPVLKNKVLKWLVQRDEVLAFCQCRPDDGGSGALLVLLKGGPPRRNAGTGARSPAGTTSATSQPPVKAAQAPSDQPQAASAIDRLRSRFL